MYIASPETITQLYVNNDSARNKYIGLMNANFQDYMDSLVQGGKFQFRAKELVQRVSQLTSVVGLAAGSLAGPAGLATGYSIGNIIGKYLGSVLSEKTYGQAIADMAEISQLAKVRHSQLAASVAFTNQMDGGIETLRQNENRRKKDDIQAMQV